MSERYIVDQIPGLDLWFVHDTKTGQQVGPMRAERIVADAEAGDLNFQLDFDTDPQFRADYLASVQARKGVEF